MKYLARLGGRDLEVELDTRFWPEVRAVVGGHRLDVRLTEVGQGLWWFSLNGRSVEAAVVLNEDGYTVRIGEDAFEVLLLDRRQRLRNTGSRGGGDRLEIRAPMPGRVVGVLVGEGVPVEAGEGLVVLEAMKMQNEIRAPRGGFIRAVATREGATVNAGDLLAVLE